MMASGSERTLALSKQKAGWVHQKGEPLILGLSSLEDKQGDYRGNQDQECNELGDTHIAP